MDVPEVYYCSKADSRSRKIAGIGREAIFRLANNDNATYAAKHIRQETIRCFEADERVAGETQILEWMRQSVCLPTPATTGATIEKVSQVSTDLDKGRLSCD